jgi:omega-amidase
VYGGPIMRVANLQYDISSDPNENLSVVEAQLRLAAERGVELVLLPEMWASSFPSSGADLGARVESDRRSVKALQGWSESLGICVGGSALEMEGERVFNRLEFFAAGERVFHYDKVHLFTPTAEHMTFSAGELPPPVGSMENANGEQVLLSGGICYDLRFPELFRFPSRAGAEILCLPAQWPTPREGHWESLSIARAVENQCFVLASNRTGEAFIGRRKQHLEFPGNSLIISPYGEVIARGAGQVGLVEADIDLNLVREFRVRIPVQKDCRPDLYGKWSEAEASN